jgi:hypothetical protein
MKAGSSTRTGLVRVVAEVVECEPLGDGADVYLVGHAMRPELRPSLAKVAAIPESAVASGSNFSCPDPAAGLLINADLGQESLLTG